MKKRSFDGAATEDAGADAIEPNEDVDGAANCNRDCRNIVFDETTYDVLSMYFANGLFLM